MSKSVYNSAILDVRSNPVRRARNVCACVRDLLWLSTFIFGLITLSVAADWNAPEQNLARKIAAIAGPAPVSVSFENRSSLSKRDTDIVENGIRSAMQAVGLHFVSADHAIGSIAISLSENPTCYVWVAEIHPGGGDPAVVIVSTPRSGGPGQDTFPVSVRSIPLYTQEQPILDVAVLDEASTPNHIAVLDPENVSWYRMRNGRWEQEQTLMIPREQSWPRDLRGRLILRHDHSLDVYLPGVFCTTEAQSGRLNCRKSDDPWPLLPSELSGALPVFPSADVANGASTVSPQLSAFFAPARNFFTGVITPGIGKLTTLPKFFSAAVLPLNNGVLWLFAGVDGRVHTTDGASDQVEKFSWGSDLASVKTGCGAGWQVLASSAEEKNSDSIRAYEFPDHDPVAVSPDVEFDGTVTALWTEPHGDTVIAVNKNKNTGTYEAFRLAMVCGQ